jgi:hypothetical protein
MYLLKAASKPTVAYKIKRCGKTHEFIVRCLQSKTVFCRTLPELALDLTLIYQLSPTQSCSLGLECGEYLNDITPTNPSDATEISPGIFVIQYQDREGNICYLNRITQQISTMKPEKLAFSSRLITQFNAAQAFYIGLSVGIKRRRMKRKGVALLECSSEKTPHK